MQDFFDKTKAQINKLLASFSKQGGEGNAPAVATTVNENYEINLVPDVKLEMIKTQKIRNLVLFICIVVSAAAVGVVVVLFSIKSGQDIAIAAKDNRIEKMSEKLNSFGELDDLVTLQGQLEKLSSIADKKRVLSRVFMGVRAMMPQNGDLVALSELHVDLDESTLTVEGQADARTNPLIDYRVLESFKKAASLVKYDYGNYVDARGTTIPSRCIRETDADGNTLATDDNLYAWWDLTIDGCQAVRVGELSDSNVELYYSEDAEVEFGNESAEGGDNENAEGESGGDSGGDENGNNSGNVGAQRVKIWRTPQFNKWYDEEKMDLNGAISDVEHFETECFKYSGMDIAGSVKWASTNDCGLLDGEFEVTESSNGRSDSDNLVLRFEGKMAFDAEFFKFKNKHMLAISPTGQNVTDSFMQIQGMFTKPAEECDPEDTECLNNKNNSSGEETKEDETSGR